MQGVEAGGSGVQGHVHLHSSQDMPGIYETLSGRGRRERETEEGKEGWRDGWRDGGTGSWIDCKNKQL